MPDAPDAHRRGDQGKEQDRGEHDVGRYRVSILAHEVPPISQIQNTGNRHRQDDGIEGLGDDHDDDGSRLEDWHHQPEQ